MTPVDKDMNRLDGALKNALRPSAAPVGFADRVLARVAQQNSSPKLPHRDPWLRFFTQPLVRWAALAAVAAATLLGIHLYEVRRERARGEAAKQRLMLALRLASNKLQLAKSKVNEMNANQTRNRQLKD